MAGRPLSGARAVRGAGRLAFYGRDELADQLVRRLAERLDGAGILLVAGESGSGKSSLLRAGLLPRLAAGALGPGSERLDGAGSDPAHGQPAAGDGKLLAAAEADGYVRLWNPVTGQAVGAPLPADAGLVGGVKGVAFSPGREAPGHRRLGRHRADMAAAAFR